MSELQQLADARENWLLTAGPGAVPSTLRHGCLTVSATAVRTACADARVTLQDVPAGPDLQERITHIARHVDTLLHTGSG